MEVPEARLVRNPRPIHIKNTFDKSLASSECWPTRSVPANSIGTFVPGRGGLGFVALKVCPPLAKTWPCEEKIISIEKDESYVIQTPSGVGLSLHTAAI
jgi:hypothetical protein